MGRVGFVAGSSAWEIQILARMIPAIVHQVWFGDAMPEPLRRMTHGVRVMHESWPWSYIAWDEYVFRTVFGEDPHNLKNEWGSWASVSNYARLLVLEKFGGTYLDVDFVCHKPLYQLIHGLGVSAVAAEQDGNRICNAFMAAEAHHPWIKRQIEGAQKYKGQTAEWGVYNATETRGDDVTIVPQHLVYPWLYNDPPEKRKPHPDSVLEHTWAKAW